MADGVNQLENYRRRIERVMELCVPRSKRKDGSGTPWEYIASREERMTFQYIFRVPSRFSALDLEEHIDALFAACGAHVEIKDKAGMVIINVYPNDLPEMIYFDDRMIKGMNQTTVLLGYDRQLHPVVHDFSKHPHLLIGSLPTYGKTTLIRMLVYQLLRKFPPDRLQLIILDFKMYSFMPFVNIPNILIAIDLKGAYNAVKAVFEEMERRAKVVVFQKNRKIIQSFPYIFLIVDEAVQISPKLVAKKDRELAGEIDRMVARIACLSRESRINLVYCTQRPDAESINGQVRGMMTAHVGFRTNDVHSSKIIIKVPGLEKLPANIKGRAIYATDQSTIMQVPYVVPNKDESEDDAWDRILSTIGGDSPEHVRSASSTQEWVETDHLDADDESAADNHGASGPSNPDIPGQPSKASFRDFIGFREGGDDSRQEPPYRGIKDLAFDENGPINLGPFDDETDELE